MALTSTLGSPGIEIREVDNSSRLNSSTSTTIFIPGFASQGPVDEVMSISNISDFETIYGVPTNAAERYFYYTVKSIVDGSGAGTTVLCSRLPYGKEGGDTVSNAYTMLVYPAVPVIKKKYGTPDKPIYYNFDQYVFAEDDVNNPEKAFRNAFHLEGIGGDLPEIIEFVLTLDDDAKQDSIKMTSIPSVTIPQTTANYFDDSGNVNDEILAPTITFEDGSVANGQMALELKDGKNYLHLSYSIIKNSKQIGSLYTKLMYNDQVSNAAGYKTLGVGMFGNGKLELIKAYETTDTYNGNDEITYVVGSPVTYHVSLSEYYKIITGEYFKWSNKPYSFTKKEGKDIDKESEFGYIDSIGHAAFIAINTSRSIINNNFEGFYIGMTDNIFTSPSEDYVYNAINSIKITTKYYDKDTNGGFGLIDKIDQTGNFQTISTNRLSFHLDNNYQGSVSQVLSRNITSMDVSGTEYDDTINMGLFKLTKSTDSSDILKLNYSLREKYNWSFDKYRLKSTSSSTRPVSAFVENVLENSSNITILMNPYISEKGFVDLDGKLKGKIRIFSDKLLSNLETFERKYLCNNTSNSIEMINNSTKKKVISAMIPATIAKSSIDSWATLVAQAGLTPNFIKTHFKNYSISSTPPITDKYYNFHPLNSLIPFGTYTEATDGNKIIGELPQKLERALELVENDEQYPDIDIILEGGLGTIFAYSKSETLESEGTSGKALLNEDGISNNNDLSNEFDETAIIQGIEDLRTGRTSLSEYAQNFIDYYTSIQNVFLGFANSMQNGGRGDTFYISDIPRGIVIKGKNTKISNLFGSTIENNAYDFGQTVKHSFSTSIYYPIKHVFDGIVSSYASTYAQWVKVYDVHSSEKVWIPISGYIAANMAATDMTYGPWYAAAGLRRGVINGTLDYAISPSTTQRTDLYKICINSVPKIPNYGVTIYGIRTMSKKDSAFDQNTCRRTFLYMEKKVKQNMRYYIFEPNTSYTRLQIYNDLYPFLEKIKNQGGIYSYSLICDATNNTPDIINNGDLVVSISAAPTRTAENIIVEFTANKYTEEVSASESMN